MVFVQHDQTFHEREHKQKQVEKLNAYRKPIPVGKMPILYGYMHRLVGQIDEYTFIN